MIGQTLSHYRIVEKIGAGGMGVVYEAEDTRLKRKVAIKILPPELAIDSQRLERFEREARALAALNHPNIITIHDIGKVDSTSYIAMELVDGKSLREILGAGCLSTREMLPLAIQIADGLANAHMAGIVHRDLKPENLMVTSDGLMKILDFGLAKLMPRGTDVDSEMTTMTRATREGVVLGTVQYMSPEQAAGRLVDYRSDQFSFGSILYEMAAGRPAFKRDTMPQTQAAIIEDEPEPLIKLKVNVPAQLSAIVQRCLSKDPKDRYDSTRDLARDLKNVPETSRAWRTRRSVPWAAAGLLAAILAIALGVNLGRLRDWLLPSDTPSPIKSMAVLPLQNLSGDPEQDYFVDGMTEALITDLSRIGELTVISRSSAMRYKGTDKPLSQIAEELNVEAFVEGSVVREGDRVGITARLIEAATETNLWADRYEREISSILTLQGEVAQAIAREIQVTLTPQEEALLTRDREVNPEAYEAYLKGQVQFYELTPAGLEAAQHYFERALEEDPDYAPAHAGMALVWAGRQQMGLVPTSEAGPKGKAAAERALEIDDSVAEAHYALALARAWSDWDWEGAETAFLRAIELKPNLADVRAFYSHYLLITGRRAEAIGQMERALELDPYNTLVQALNAAVLVNTDRCEEALDFHRSTLEAVPNHPLALSGLVGAYYCLGRYEETYAAAVAHFEALGEPDAVAALERGYAEGGFREAMSALGEWKLEQDYDYYFAVFNFVAAGKNREALDCLERAFEEHDPNLPYIAVHSHLRPLKNEPRFQELLRRMNLPAS